MTGVVERSLPANLDAERSVLGAALVTYGKSLDTIADQLEGKHFYRDAHRRIYEAMLVLYQRGDPVDFVLLQEVLAKAGNLDEVGGPAYISALTSGMPAAVNVAHYARIVREKAVARDVIYAANRILASAYEDDAPVADLVDAAERALLDVSHDAVPGDLVHASELVRQAIPVFDAITSARRPVTGLASGFPDLDRFTRGFQPGNLIIIAARPGQGKTTLTTQIALHVSKTTPVAFFSLEMSQIEQVFRIIATLGRVDGHQLLCGQLSMLDVQLAAGAFGEFAERQFWLDDTADLSALQIRSRARRLKAKEGLGLIVVDYLQLLHHAKAESREQQVAATARQLLKLGRELKVPVIAVCQLNRASEQRQDQRPKLSDLRESGSLEQDAHMVLLMHRQPRKPGDQTIPPTELIIAKQRNGPTTSVDLHWLGEQYRFAEMEMHQ